MQGTHNIALNPYIARTKPELSHRNELNESVNLSQAAHQKCARTTKQPTKCAAKTCKIIQFEMQMFERYL